MKIGRLFIIMFTMMALICLSACGASGQTSMADGSTASSETEKQIEASESLNFEQAPKALGIGEFDFDTHAVLLNSGYAMPISNRLAIYSCIRNLRSGNCAVNTALAM